MLSHPRKESPGTVTHIKVDSRNMCHYFFLPFGASIHGDMQYLRSIINVDYSYLKGSYKGILLLATVQDATKRFIS